MIRSELREDSKIRFRQKVEKSLTCWNWIAAKTEKGYGVFGIGKETDKAHRISWRLKRGDIPLRMFVLHRCDNPACVRPSHLFLGSNQDNVDDMIRKGRNSKPPYMAGHNRKTIPKKFMSILGKVSDAEIARRCAVSKAVIRRLRKERGILALPSQTRFKKDAAQHPRWGRKCEVQNASG